MLKKYFILFFVFSVALVNSAQGMFLGTYVGADKKAGKSVGIIGKFDYSVGLAEDVMSQKDKDHGDKTLTFFKRLSKKEKPVTIILESNSQVLEAGKMISQNSQEKMYIGTQCGIPLFAKNHNDSLGSVTFVHGDIRSPKICAPLQFVLNVDDVINSVCRGKREQAHIMLSRIPIAKKTIQTTAIKPVTAKEYCQEVVMIGKKIRKYDDGMYQPIKAAYPKVLSYIKKQGKGASNKQLVELLWGTFVKNGEASLVTEINSWAQPISTTFADYGFATGIDQALKKSDKVVLWCGANHCAKLTQLFKKRQKCTTIIEKTFDPNFYKNGGSLEDMLCSNEQVEEFMDAVEKG